MSRADFPALSAFLAGYLHEDYVPEHGSVPRAARAFAADADATERRTLDVELRRFLAATAGWPLAELQQALAGLGSAWAPADRAELEALLAGNEDGPAGGSH